MLLMNSNQSHREHYQPGDHVMERVPLDLSLYFDANPHIQQFAILMSRELAFFPSSVTSSLILAHSIGPQLIATESPPSLFALRHRSSPAEAASRLCGYWSHRSLLLGSNAYRPIQQVMAAITHDDHMFASTCLQTSPTSDVTRMGLLIVIDASRISLLNQETNMRHLFLHLQEALRSAASSITFAFLGIEGATPISLGPFIDGASKMISGGMPFSVDKVYLAGSENPNAAPVFSFGLSQVLQSGLSQDCIVTTSPSIDGLRTKLRDYGLVLANPTKTHIPFAQEFRTDLAPPVARMEPNFDFSFPAGTSTSVASYSMPNIGVPEVSEGKIGSSRQSAASLSREIADSPRTNPKDPEMALDTTKSKITSEDDKRKRNAIYSRRKYVRKKIEFEVLEEECSRLREHNNNLKQEEDLLKRLLRQANECIENSDTLDQKPKAVEKSDSSEHMSSEQGNVDTSITDAHPHTSPESLGAAQSQAFAATSSGSSTNPFQAVARPANQMSNLPPNPSTPNRAQPLLGSFSQGRGDVEVGGNLLNPNLAARSQPNPAFGSSDLINLLLQARRREDSE